MPKQTGIKRNIPSEAKIQCKECKKKLKFRMLRQHMKEAHKILDTVIYCSLENIGCEWVCGVSFDCYLEHSKHDHGENFQTGADTIFSPENGFHLVPIESDHKIHTEACVDSRELHKKCRKVNIQAISAL